jgi:AcrR family transcriptional regulator
VPSKNVDASVIVDRRTRKRDERRDHLLALAARLVDDRGLSGLTMAALAEEADYATASLYTYFASHGALVGALQARALEVLGQVGVANLARWDDALGQPASARARKVAALARLWAFADLFLTAPEHHAHEFRLQQELLASPAGDDGPAGTVVIAAAMGVLDLPRRLLAEAVAVKAIDAPADVRNPADDPVDGDMARTLTWIAAMNGVLLLDGLGEAVPLPGLALGRDLTGSVLRGWGADPTLLAAARTAANDWTDR